MARTKDCVKLMSPSAEKELQKLLIDNCVCALGCLLVWVILTVISVTLFGKKVYLINYTFSLMIIEFFASGVFFTVCLVFLNGFLSSFLETDSGDRVGKWCRNKVFAYFLMLNLFNLSHTNRSRTAKVLHRIKQEFEDPDV